MSVEITGQKGEVSVGERIKLGVNYTKEWGTLKSARWTIPGLIVKDYVGDAQPRAQVVKMPEADFQNPTIDFHWVDGGDGRVVKADCVFTSGGQDTNKTVQSTFDVKRPSVRFSAITGRVGIHEQYGDPWLQYGDASPVYDPRGVRGIFWTAQVQTGPKGKGELKYVQLINGRTWFVTTGGRRAEWAQPSGRYDLDAENPYDGTYATGAGQSVTYSTEDSPGNRLRASSSPTPGLVTGHGQGVKLWTNQGDFKLWLMFKPDSPSGAIWVPLSMLTWKWSGTAVPDPSAELGWSIRAASNTANPVGKDTTEFPEWKYISKQGKKWKWA